MHLLTQEHGDLLSVHAQLLEDVVGHIGSLFKDTAKQMHRFDGLLTISLRNVYGFLYRLLRLDCKFVECHINISFLILYILICVIWMSAGNFSLETSRCVPPIL